MTTQFFAPETILKDNSPLVRFSDDTFKTTSVKGSRIFSCNNSKLIICGKTYNERMVSFDLRAGLTCPAALLCLSHFDEKLGKIVDGKHAAFRCYAASQEGVYKNTRDLRARNKELAESENFVQIICDEIAKYKITCIRIHSSGDFYNGVYMQKWIQIAKLNPNVRFFGYTKMASFIKFLNAQPNMFFVYSNGGVYDGKAILNGIPTNTVTNSESESVERGLPVTCKDNHKASDYEMIVMGKSFSIVIHGTQPKKQKGKKTLATMPEKLIMTNDKYDLDAMGL